MKTIQSAIIIIILFIICACEKSSIPPAIDNSMASLSIKTDKDTIYRLGVVNFEANDTLGDLNYQWNFGDGASELGGFKIQHQYEKPGIHKVTLKINDLTSYKEIFVLPAMMSYQIKNESKQNIDFKSFVCNPDDFGFVRSILNSGNITDTIYSNSIGIGIKIDFIIIHIFINGVEYRNNPDIMVESLQHHVVKLNDSSEFLKILNTDIGPNKITLGEL